MVQSACAGGVFKRDIFLCFLKKTLDNKRGRQQTAVGSKENGCCIWAELSRRKFNGKNSGRLTDKLRIVQLRYPYTCRAVQPIEFCARQQRIHSDIEPSPAPVRSLHTVSSIYVVPLRSYPKRLNHGHTLSGHFQPSTSLTIAVLYRRRLPLLSGGVSLLPRGSVLLYPLRESGEIGCPGSPR